MGSVSESSKHCSGGLKGKHSTRYNSLIINGHIDVAEVNEDEEWDIDPFYL